ncbi:uncharacterized protein O3C94_018172 [Discoglossus pictus]
MTTYSTMGLLYTISEGSQGESPSISPQSAESTTPVHETKQEINSKQLENNAVVQNGYFNKGKSHPRLAQLRGHIRAQVREHSPRNQMLELVDKVTHGQKATKGKAEGGKHHVMQEVNKPCQCASPTCFASELEGRLHVELSALRLEVKNSLEALRLELGQELRALHKDVKVCCHHCPVKGTDSPKAGEKRPEWKNVFKKVNHKEEQEVRSPAKLDGQIKARSVPSLVPQTGPSRNQVLLRAMTTISAKNALVSSMGIRSNSDPAQPSPGKQNKNPVIKEPTHSNVNWGKKVINKTVAPLPQNGVPAANTH